MATEVALLAGSPDRELGALALDMRSTLPLDTKADIPATIDGLRAALLPLKQVEPGAVIRDASKPTGFRFDGVATEKLADALRPIGAKLNPTMSAEQVGGWLAAMIASLSDLPPRAVIRGTQDALHVAIRFFSEVEGVIRDKAEQHAVRYRAAIARLERLQREIAEASAPRLEEAELSAPTDEELAKLAGTDLGQSLLRMWLGSGWINQEQFDAAMASHDVKEPEA